MNLEQIKENYPEVFEQIQAIDYSVCLSINPRAAIVPVEHHECKYANVILHLVSTKTQVNKLMDLWEVVNAMEKSENRKKEIEIKEKRSKAKLKSLEENKKEKNKIF